MTVNSQELSNQWTCQWFDGSKFNKETFHGDQLTDKNPVEDTVYSVTRPKRNNSW